MSNKKRIIIGIAAFVAIIVVAVVVFVIKLHSSGVHIYRNLGNINITKECWYFDENGQNGTAVVTISGSVNSNKGVFEGTISVDRDSELHTKLADIPESGSNICNFVALKDGNDYGEEYPDEYIILYYGTLFDYDDDRLVPDLNYEYKVYLNDDGTFVLAAMKYDDEGQQVYRFTVINAPDEETAAEWFEIQRDLP